MHGTALSPKVVIMGGEHECPGCGTAISLDEIACRRCYRRLPRHLRRALAAAKRIRYRDHEPYLDALREARQWWAEHAR